MNRRSVPGVKVRAASIAIKPARFWSSRRNGNARNAKGTGAFTAVLPGGTARKESTTNSAGTGAYLKALVHPARDNRFLEPPGKVAVGHPGDIIPDHFRRCCGIQVAPAEPAGINKICKDLR